MDGSARRVRLDQVPLASFRIGADDEKARARGDALVAGARRQRDDIAGRDLEIAALSAAEPQGGVANRDAEHLMGGRVVVMEGEDAPAPAPPPIVLGEFPLEGARRILFVRLDRAAIEDRGQTAVRNAAVILEEGRLDADRVSARQRPRLTRRAACRARPPSRRRNDRKGNGCRAVPATPRDGAAPRKPGRSVSMSPQFEPSKSDTWVGTAFAGRDAASTAKP